ncbi:MAG: saccharopine dehydrogenase NADP-binding domain-containing protein [Ignavibacteriales bacterium]|nr:saccharopine dehydrogenase NADP-binding domain-containing protein [Ignavibacteriales bacterium]
MNILVLGCGLVGGPMVMDLAKDDSFSVSVADFSEKNLDKLPGGLPVNKIVQDLSNIGELRNLLTNYDMVLNAVPGHLGFVTLKEAIESGKNVVDIAFYPEDPFLLDELAKQKQVTAIVDCGVAPGMSNLLAGYVNSLLDKTESILIYVGGLPVVREYPFEYKAGFSPADVIEEYTRPARYIENGQMVIRPALSDAEYLNFPQIGTLEAFNSDGLRSLMYTLQVPNMKEKTLRYPGHIEKMLVLRESGFFSHEYIELNGAQIKPIDLTSKLLFNLWELKKSDRDFTVMKIIVEGEKNGKRLRYTYDLLDYCDEEAGIHSMARTTGYTATTAIRMLAKGMYNRKGISPPEYIGTEHDCVQFILSGLQEKGINYKQTIEILK